MTLREKFNKLKFAAQADVRAVRTRATTNGGYWGNNVDINRALLKEDVRTAATLGYETHLRVIDDKLHVFYVKNMPSAPTDVLYA